MTVIIEEKLNSVALMYCNIFLRTMITKSSFVQSSYKMMSDAVAKAPYYRDIWLKKAKKVSELRSSGVFQDWCRTWDAERILDLLGEMKEDLRPFQSISMSSSVQSLVLDLIKNINEVEKDIRDDIENKSTCTIC